MARRWSKRALARLRGYDAADTIRSTQRVWSGVEDVTGNRLDESTLALLRAKCLHEWRNDSYARGVTETYASDVVGPYGPRLKIHSRTAGGEESEEWNDALLRRQRRWQRQCDVTGRLSFAALLRQAIRALFPSGEALFVVLATPDSLRLQPVAAKRLSTPWGKWEEKTRLGIEMDRQGRPTRYHLADGDSWTAFPAERILHYFHADMPEQIRGVPLLVTALEAGAIARDWIKACLVSLQTAAKFAVLLESDLPPADLPTIQTDEDEGADEDEVPILDIPSAAIVQLPDGQHAVQIKPEHPPALFTDVVAEVQRQIGRCVGMPRIRVAADSSDSNYSASRLDVQSYWRIVEADQEHLETVICEPCLRLLASQPGLPPEPEEWWATWTWPRPPVIDEQKEAQAAMVRLASHRSTLAEEALGDWQDTVRTQARIERLAASEGTSVLPAQVRLTMRGDASIPGANTAADEIEQLVADETGAEVDVSALLPGDSVAADQAASNASTVQDTALNGAQVAALQSIVQAVAEGTLPAESAVQMLLVSFPTISQEQAQALVSPADGFVQEVPSENA